MPKLKDEADPAYRLHRKSGMAVVTLTGLDFSLGKWGSSQSKQRYHELVAKWRANGKVALREWRVKVEAPSGPLGTSIDTLVARYREHVTNYYRLLDGKPSGEADNIRLAIRPFCQAFGATDVNTFSPPKLESFQELLAKLGWCRTYINRQVGRIRAMFKWGVRKELVPVGIYQALTTVPGLKQGKTGARENPRVKPAHEALIEQMLGSCSQTIRDMIWVQKLAAARPGEVCRLRAGDIDRSTDVWRAELRQHKTTHHGLRRILFFGYRCQDILQPYLTMLMDPNAFVFCSPKSKGARPYTVAAYRRAIARACELVFQPPSPLGKQEGESVRAWHRRLSPSQRTELTRWNREHRFHPHQLRHTAGTDIRRQFGLEASQHMLGHAHTKETELYAEKNFETAERVAKAIG